MKLIPILKEFSDLFGRDGIDIGNIEFKNIKISNTPLEIFYEVLLFDNTLTVVGDFLIHITPLNMLNEKQKGWYLCKDKNNRWYEDNENWNKEWIVFGDRNGDAIYYNKLGNSVWGSVNKKKNYKIASSLDVFFEILTACMHLEMEKYNFCTKNED
ncbi:MAG: hypothetical protein ACPG5P_03260, partial [Saprospiraceae bacterium]